jgi:hypothetical protein
MGILTVFPATFQDSFKDNAFHVPLLFQHHIVYENLLSISAYFSFPTMKVKEFAIDIASPFISKALTSA